MSGIFFYSILIFILLSIFAPSIYNYAYKCFIGRIVLVLLIIYFSKHSIILGLIFVTIIIFTSYPLYEGLSSSSSSPGDDYQGEDILATQSLVTSNYSIKDKTNKQQVFNYFTKYYCDKDSNGNVRYPLRPNQIKYKRWYDIFKNQASDTDSKNITSTNIMLQNAICNPDTSRYYSNYGANFQSAVNTGNTNFLDLNGCSTNVIDENMFCGYWAAVGECSRNPGYMLTRCKASCNRVSGSPTDKINQVYNFPICFQDNFKSQICNSKFIQDLIPSARNTSKNPDVDPYLNQDGQWVLNMYQQVCAT